MCVSFMCACAYLLQNPTQNLLTYDLLLCFFISLLLHICISVPKKKRERKSKTTSRQTDLPQPVQCRSFGLCVRGDLKGYKAQYASVMSANDSS